jgi:hypothetical protein
MSPSSIGLRETDKDTERQTDRQIERQNKDYYQPTGDCHSPSQQERVKPGGVISQQNRLEGVEQTEVESPVDEDANAADDESAVQASEPI